MGVASIVATVAVGRGAEREVVDRINAKGRNVLMVVPGRLERNPTRPGTAGALVTNLRQADGREILRNSPFVTAVVPVFQQGRRLTYGNFSTSANVVGSTHEYGEVREFHIERGRYFTPSENRGAQRLAVIGSLVRDELFSDTDPLGKSLFVERVPFRIIGVLASKGISLEGGASEDDRIIIPINTAQRRVFNVDYLTWIYVQVSDQERMETVGANITSVLRRRHDLDHLSRPDDFLIENPRLIMAAQVETAEAFSRMITGLGAVVLVVSGVGILSLMTLSVRERRGEVGLRVAVGARRRDVLTQFLLEALAIAAIGGLTGLVLGFGTVTAIGQWTEWRTVLSAPSAVVALASALVIGGLFGVYPAHRAASWHPVLALRAE